MYPSIKNLVFEGGGIFGISYLGVLDYLDEVQLLPHIQKVAGTSAGAIASCLACFNTSFNELKKMASTLDYKKMTSYQPLELRDISQTFKEEFEKIFGDLGSVYRLINNYGWYSTEYFYDWIKKIIASQFNQSLKPPPYTFEDFQNSDIHINNKEFKDLYIVGTDISYKIPVIFSYETTPEMEVAEAIRISMSIPLFFEAVKIDDKTLRSNTTFVYADGGLMKNYPINIFDYNGINHETLGVQFVNKIKYKETNNIIDYICNVFNALLKTQDEINENDYINQKRSININTGGISSLDFDLSESDYKFLYDQGYSATLEYFENRII